jgi:uncharacterized protein (TIGR02611 family)
MTSKQPGDVDPTGPARILDSVLDKAEDLAAPDAKATLDQLPKAGVFRQVNNFIARSGKRIAVAIVGGAVLLAGVAMMVLPGPGIVVILMGLGILATEFAWARTALDRAKEKAEQAKQMAIGGDQNRKRFLIVVAVVLAVVGAAASWWWFRVR